ncbi:MAG: hypothetical protein R3C46_16480 [Hyphomonadaceae bacterium]
MKKRDPLAALAVLLATVASACSTMSYEAGDSAFMSCPAYQPAYDVTDDFMRTFNMKDAKAWGSTFHFPSVRIASGKVTIIESPADLENSFPRLAAIGWDHSAWASRKVVQCDATKAHMLTTFVRYRADGSELSRFNSLYIVEQRDGRWSLTARSSFAP